MTHDPCECCGRTDLPTGHGLCGYGFNCSPCLYAALSGTDDAEHLERHER